MIRRTERADSGPRGVQPRSMRWNSGASVSLELTPAASSHAATRAAVDGLKQHGEVSGQRLVVEPSAVQVLGEPPHGPGVGAAGGGGYPAPRHTASAPEFEHGALAALVSGIVLGHVAGQSRIGEPVEAVAHGLRLV